MNRNILVLAGLIASAAVVGCGGRNSAPPASAVAKAGAIPPTTQLNRSNAIIAVGNKPAEAAIFALDPRLEIASYTRLADEASSPKAPCSVTSLGSNLKAGDVLPLKSIESMNDAETNPVTTYVFSKTESESLFEGEHTQGNSSSADTAVSIKCVATMAVGTTVTFQQVSDSFSGAIRFVSGR